MELTEKKVLFCDLDGTLIETKSGKVFPKGVWDVEIKLDVFEKITKLFPKLKAIFIVTNQAGIEKGYVNEDTFRDKLKWVCACLKDFTLSKNQKVKFIEGTYCDTNDYEDDWRKPNTGMLSYMLNIHPEFGKIQKEDIVMLGDASGKLGQFSDSDLMTAKKFKIDYIDVEDLLAM